MVRQAIAASYNTGRKIVVGLAGATVLAVGVVMIILPGPAIVVIPIGLAILALEFAWARRWLRHVQEKADRVIGQVRRAAR